MLLCVNRLSCWFLGERMKKNRRKEPLSALGSLCVYVCVCVRTITQPTGPAVITAEFIVTTDWTNKIKPPSPFCIVIGSQKSFPFSDWLQTSAPPISLVLPRVVAWLHQKLIYLSRALDVYCSTSTDRVQTETTSHTLIPEHTHTHTSSEDATECTQAIP